MPNFRKRNITQSAICSAIHIYGHLAASKKRQETKAPENEPQLATSAFNKSGSVSAARFVMIVAANHGRESVICIHLFPFFLFGTITCPRMAAGWSSQQYTFYRLQSFIPPGKSLLKIGKRPLFSFSFFFPSCLFF